MTLRSDIFQSNSLSGTTTVRNGFANVNIDINPYGLTGNINFIVQLRKGSISGDVLASTPPIQLIDLSRLISFEPNVYTISEGQDVRFDILTANVPDGSRFYYAANAFSGNVTEEDFLPPITGTLIINNNQANILISSNSIATTAVETGEIFDIQLRVGSLSGETVATSNVVEILDTANIVDIVSVIPNSNVIFESESVILTVNTVNALGTNSKILYYSITGNADIFGSNSGSFLITNNLANVEIIAEGSVPENESREFNVQFRRNSISGTILTSIPIIVNSANVNTALPFSKTYLVTNVINRTSGDIFYNSNVQFDIQTRNVANNETLYYTILNAANTNIVGGNTKPFVVQTGNTSTNVIVQLNLPNEFANISMQVRRNISGPVLNESDNVAISVLPAIGGTIIDEGSFITHVFTTSSNLIVSPYYNLTSNVLMVGGGGGGERSGTPGPIQGAGGGGGAGGLILREGTANAVVMYSGNTYPIVIGGGGSQATAGGNTTAFTMIALGGGRGLANPARNPALSAGGSGGGSGFQSFGNPTAPIPGGPGVQTTSLAIPVDSRLYGFGTPGSASFDNSSTNGGGGGAGVAGARGPGGDGIPIQWIPETYGTSGPAPGRWFGGGGASTSGAGGAGGGGSLSPGIVNTGGGGGGGTASITSDSGRPGGSGVVIIRYPKP